uniref:Uncharacterized protein n=1 Tax=Anguilla anguilla TaxID=7936 RepID=A0A0E9Q4S2_ANGAN
MRQIGFCIARNRPWASAMMSVFLAGGDKCSKKPDYNVCSFFVHLKRSMFLHYR